MSNSLRNTKSQFDILTLRLRAQINTFPTFENEVVNVQRRTVRSWVNEYLKKLKVNITNELSNATAGDTGKLLGQMLGDTITVMTGTPMRYKERKVENPPWIEITPGGQISITRKHSDGLRISKAQFDACIETIRSRINQDPIDVNMSPEEIVRGYLVKYFEEEKSKLPIFKGVE